MSEFIDPRTKLIRIIGRRRTVSPANSVTLQPLTRRRSGVLTKGQKRLAFAAFFFGVIVTVAGWATNFLSVSDYAASHGFVIPWALPLGLDLAIPTLLVIDYLAAVKGANAAFLRWSAWALTGFTVYAGAVSANGGQMGVDWNSTILHGVMPAISVIFVEAARWFRMYLDGLADGTHTDRIPVARWICAPIRTGRMRRRMVLWNERSYPMAVVREAALLYGRALLDGEGRTRRSTPVSLRHQIRTGQVPASVVQAMRSAVESGDESWQPAVEEWVAGHLAKLTADIKADARADTTPDIATSPTEVRPDMSAPGHGHQMSVEPDTRPDVRTPQRADTGRPDAGHPKRTTARATEMSAGHVEKADTSDADADVDTQAAALVILARQPDISGAELGRQLGLSDRQGRRILKTLSASTRGGQS